MHIGDEVFFCALCILGENKDRRGLIVVSDQIDQSLSGSWPSNALNVDCL